MDEYLTGNFIFVRVLLNEKITHTIDIIKYINKNLFLVFFYMTHMIATDYHVSCKSKKSWAIGIPIAVNLKNVLTSSDVAKQS